MRAKYGIAEGPYLLSVCTFEPRKNLRHLVRSFVELLRAHPELSDLTLVLTGGQGWMFEPIMAELVGTALPSGRIIATGYVPDADLAPLYSGVSGFPLPVALRGVRIAPARSDAVWSTGDRLEHQQSARGRWRRGDSALAR